MDRRAFVRTCVAIGAGSALAASGLAIGRSAVQPRAPGASAVRYFGAHMVGGPAPRGIPYIPITVEEGHVVGKTTLQREGATWNVLEWYKYCGHARAPGLDEASTSDNRLYYDFPEEPLRFLKPWYAHLLGEPIRPEDFPGDGFGARFRWRSRGLDGPEVITGVLLKADPSTIGRGEEPVPPAKPLAREEMAFVLREVFHEGFIAVCNFCTHFCCAAGYKESEALTRPRNGWENVFCTCHGANFNPREPVSYSFLPEDRRAGLHTPGGVGSRDSVIL